jgi:6-pyruvoyltetrahydropterin/6-carboxytetrahydropterin synthase
VDQLSILDDLLLHGFRFDVRRHGMIRLTKRVEFCAAHRYVNPRWGEEENRRRFGKAANLHGHNYALEVTIQGTPAPETGMVMDLKALKDLITEAVLDRLDHKNLNVDVPEFVGTLPTPENLAVVIWGLLVPRLTGCALHRVRLHEDDGSYVDYYGEGARS